MDTELLLCGMFLLLLVRFGGSGILGHHLYKKYKKAKDNWHYITSTKVGMGRDRMAFEFFRIMVLLACSIYILINIHHIDLGTIVSLLAFLIIIDFYNKVNPTLGDIEIYKEGVITLKSFLNYHLVLPWKFFKGYKVEVSNKNIKHVILIPKSKLLFNIHLIDEDGKIEETLRKYFKH